MFVDREIELQALNKISERRGAQFLVVYGRRRVGKTTLLIEWGRRSKLPVLYWVAARESSALLLRSFSQAIYAHAAPNRTIDPLFSYPSWEMALREAAALAQTQRLLLIIDEFPYAAQSEPALPSLLQNSWDHVFKTTQVVLVLAGSQVGMMIDSLSYHAPLYGRTTAQLFLPDVVGRHWSSDVEIDVVAINWRQRQLLLGECKWGVDEVGSAVIESLVMQRSPRVLAKLKAEGWQTHFVFFARTGFTEPARQVAATVNARLVDLATLGGSSNAGCGSKPVHRVSYRT